MRMQQNEFLFKRTAICTSFGPIYSKILCNMPQNTVHFGAKRKAFWCYMQGVLPLNAVRFAAKCETISIKIRRDGINITS